MKNFLIPIMMLLTLVLLSSCGGTERVFLCENIHQVRIYESKKKKADFNVVPSGKNLIAFGKKGKKYRKVRYKSHEGYAYKETFKSEKELTASQYFNLYFDEEEGRYFLREKATSLPEQPSSSTFSRIVE